MPVIVFVVAAAFLFVIMFVVKALGARPTEAEMKDLQTAYEIVRTQLEVIQKANNDYVATVAKQQEELRQARNMEMSLQQLITSLEEDVLAADDVLASRASEYVEELEDYRDQKKHLIGLLVEDNELISALVESIAAES